MLKEYNSDDDYIIHWDSKLFDKALFFEKEPISLLHKDVLKWRTKFIPSMKV